MQNDESTNAGLNLPSVEEQRAELRHQVIDAPNRLRIVFVGNFFQGPTGIVASMHRALENLGHTVFKLDTKRHKDVLDRSSGATGGYGPIWFKPEAVSQIISTFRPDALVLCAGGMVLTPEGSSYLRDRGVLSIGLTLSDPDVQDSVIDHVGNFDLHATNAQLAYDRYLREGHTNTFMFPFGIDRSFILRDVADDPALHADAIAIGHAQGRFDRHEIMVPLANRVSVRTYGTGWPLPGSEPVAGDRLLQAAKGGKVHVNFPATRAGFTNVKCGVFETIGAGAVLATTKFDEMGRLFEYGTEILAYQNADDLGDSIQHLLANPDALEAMRRRSFHRLLADHLYERRWNTFFREAQEMVASGGGPWAAEERSHIRSILATDRERPRNILISGYYGARNRGDDILLDALHARISQEVPDANVIAAAVNPLAVERMQGVQAFSRLDPFESDNYASSATGLILGPGGLWHDYTIQKAHGIAGIVTGATMSPSHLVQLPLMVRAYGGRFHVHGMGVGPLTDVAAKAGVHLTGMLADSVTVRDTASRDLLEDCRDDWPSDVVVSPDVAYTLPLANLDETEVDWRPTGDYIAVNVRPFQENAASLEIIRDVVFTTARDEGLAVVGVPMQPVDTKELESWAEFAEAEGVDFRVISQEASYSVFLRALREAKAIVSMRLHTNLFAHRLGKAPVGIAYDPKLEGHFEQLGRGEFAVAMPVDGEVLRQRLLTVLADGDLSGEALSRIRDLESQAEESLLKLCADLKDAPKKLPSVGSMVQAPPKEDTKKKRKTFWPEEQMVNLRSAVVEAGNDEDPQREVEVTRRATARGDQFGLEARAPRRGDYATWRLEVPVPDGKDGVRIELLVFQKYREKQRLAGRLSYSVTVDGTPLFHEDVTSWSERNSIWIARRTTAPTVTVEIRLQALRNTENWGWGKATVTTVEGVRVLPWEPTADLLWGASSPGAVPFSPAQVHSDADRESVLPASMRDADPKEQAPSHQTTDDSAENLSREGLPSAASPSPNGPEDSVGNEAPGRKESPRHRAPLPGEDGSDTPHDPEDHPHVVAVPTGPAPVPLAAGDFPAADPEEARSATADEAARPSHRSSRPWWRLW